MVVMVSGVFIRIVEQNFKFLFVDMLQSDAGGRQEMMQMGLGGLHLNEISFPFFTALRLTIVRSNLV